MRNLVPPRMAPSMEAVRIYDPLLWPLAYQLISKNYFIFGRTWWSRTTRSPSSPSQPISPACRPIGAASTCHLGQARPCFTGTPHIKAAQDFSRAAYTPSQKIYFICAYIRCEYRLTAQRDVQGVMPSRHRHRLQ